MTSQLVIQLLTYAVSIGCLYGGIVQRLKNLETKVDKHNHLVERMYKVEARVKLLEER